MTVFKVFERDDGPPEPVLEPALTIIDAHHHVWPEGSPIAAYGGAEFRKDLATGHNIVGTVFAECMANIRPDREEALQPVGETEYVVASFPVFRAQPAVAAGIVAWADLRNPVIAARTLDAHIAAGQGRFKGVRHNVLWHKDEHLVGPRKFPRHLLLDATFRAGLKEVARRGLTYDVWMFHEQLPELAATADALPDLTIILDHLGGPVVSAPEGRKDVFDHWRSFLPELARRPNIHLKIGGLGMHQFGFGFDKRTPRPRSSELAPVWRPYVDAAIQAFGPDRCMLESNFPVDKHSFSYETCWNVFKSLTTAYSARERDALFRTTACRAYKLTMGGAN